MYVWLCIVRIVPTTHNRTQSNNPKYINGTDVMQFHPYATKQGLRRVALLLQILVDTEGFDFGEKCTNAVKGGKVRYFCKMVIS